MGALSFCGEKNDLVRVLWTSFESALGVVLSGAGIFGVGGVD